jgi:hypothetical protein
MQPEEPTDATTPADDLNDAIARRAYEISLGDDAGTPEENWWRAAAEINGRDRDASTKP